MIVLNEYETNLDLIMSILKKSIFSVQIALLLTFLRINQNDAPQKYNNQSIN